FVLSSHYRGPINYSLEQLGQADAALERIMTALRDLPQSAPPTCEYGERFREAMDDDFNTPEAIAVLQAMTREINTAKDAQDGARAAGLAAELRSLAGVLGLALPTQWFRLRKPAQTAGAATAGATGEGGPGSAAPSDTDIDRLIAARAAARKARNWAESDRIRDELAKAGVILEDKPDGRTEWRRA
ncbi:MAG: cysteine--tRNA ligase, partial [Gammaproteobacteria bacterium]|nr:cysteine--tRNA ligase [Gammaproteobacteria bacterium]